MLYSSVKVFNVLPNPIRIPVESIESLSLYKSPQIEDFKFLYDGDLFDFGPNGEPKLDGKKPLDIFLYKNIAFNKSDGGREELSGDYFIAKQHTHYGHYINDILIPFLYIRHFVPSLKLLVVSQFYNYLNHDKYEFNDEKYKKMMLDLKTISEKYNIEIKFMSTSSKMKIENLYYWDQELFKTHPKESYSMQYDMYDITFKLANKIFSLKNEKVEKIYIGRKHGNSDSRNSISPRYIENEDLVEDYFKDLGYSVHYLEFYNMQEQIELFSKASKVVGFTGTGFTNVLWTDRENPIEVIQISSWPEYNDHTWRRIAESLGHRFFYIGMSNTNSGEKIVENLKRFNSILS